MLPCGVEESPPRVHVVLRAGGWSSLRQRLSELGPVGLVLVGEEEPAPPPESWPAIFGGRLAAMRFWSPQLLHDGCRPIHDETYARATIGDRPVDTFETRTGASVPAASIRPSWRLPPFVYLRVSEDTTMEALLATGRRLGGHYLAPVLVSEWPVDPDEPFQPWGLHQMLP